MKIEFLSWLYTYGNISFINSQFFRIKHLEYSREHLPNAMRSAQIKPESAYRIISAVSQFFFFILKIGLKILSKI